MQLISSSTGLTAAATIATGTMTSFDSIWVFGGLAIAIPLAFYVLHRVIGLFPKAGGRR